jgi:GLPGLI family protein
MKKQLSLLLLCCTIVVLGQSKNYKITYSKSSNGKIIENQDPIVVFASEKEILITSEAIINQKAKHPFEITQINSANNHIFQIATLYKNDITTMVDSLSIEKQSFTFSEETKKIQGFTCKKAITSINSNTIDLWYTTELKAKGAPTLLGIKLGVVLEMTRNNNFTIKATAITKVKQIPTYPINNNVITDALTYRDKLWKSRFVTIPIFDNEIINFSNECASNDSILRFANGTIIVKKIKLPKIATGSQVFVDLTEQSNGDAYDRTGSTFLIPVQSKTQTFLDALQNGITTLPIFENGNSKKYQGVIKTDTYSPLIELMRFFTPFGIKQFNHIQLKEKLWRDQAFYRQEISDVISPFSEQEVYIGTFIGNYDKGGHKISLTLTVHPEENQTPHTKTIIPLFNTTNIMEMAGQEYGTMFNANKGLEVTFTLEKDIKNAQLRYITTGHGGWENGDEFVPKKNSILLNEKEVFHFIPWRQDCGSYRLYNPASGNFSNGLSSSDYSRSNWCPGTITYPTYIDLGNLKAGIHTLHVKIPQGEPEEGSFSAWNVSGILIGE